MITINRNGKFTIPQSETHIGYKTNNLLQKKFYIEGLMDISLAYKLQLKFHDGSCNYFLVDSQVVDGGTLIEWDINNGTFYLPGSAEIQIVASNGSGEVFRSDTIKIMIDTSVTFTSPAVSCTYEASA